MSANWALPTGASTYANLVLELDARLDDLALGLDSAYVTASSIPTNAIRYNSTGLMWERYNGTTWGALLAVASGAFDMRVTNSNQLYTARSLTIGGDLAWTTSFNGSANVSATGTLATVNTAVGTYGTASQIASVTVNGKGLVTNVTNILLGTMANQNANNVTISGGSITGLTTLEVPKSAGAAPTAAGQIAFNTTDGYPYFGNAGSTYRIPTATGLGASGTWGIAISGNAASATTATAATSATTATNATSATTATTSTQAVMLKQNYANSAQHVHTPSSGSYRTTAATTGTIKVTLPNSWNNHMLRIVIKGFDYTNNNSHWQVDVSGYNYSTTPAWVNSAVTISTNELAALQSVRLGHDGTKCCILIGTLASVWQYPQVFVEAFFAGFGGGAVWDTGWNVTTIASEAGITNIASPTVKFAINSAQSWSNPAWITALAASKITGQLALANGGTNANLTAVNGGIVYSGAAAFAISAAGTSGQVLTSAGAGAPTWTSQSSLLAGTATNTVFTTDATNAAQPLVFASAAGTSGARVAAASLTYNPNSYQVSGIGSMTMNGTVQASNFRDANLSYNVNLATGGGSEGRSFVAGYSGTGHPGFGYNIRHTVVNWEVYIPSTNTWNYMHMSAGGWNMYGGTATAGATVTWSSFPLVTINSSGDFACYGDATVRGDTLATVQPTFNLLNITATTINFAGAATNLNIGAATSTFTGDIVLSGGDLTGPVTANLFNVTSTTINFGGAATLVNIGAATATGYVNIASTRASTSTITGALIVNGGIGVAGSANLGGSIVAAISVDAPIYKAIDNRVLTNPSTGLGYIKGGRFRFSALNDNNTTPYADVIDLSTYFDSSGGGYNALYLSKASQTIVHKWGAAGATAWTTKTLAYTDGTGATGSWTITATNVSGVVGLANGGTGATSAGAARTALALGSTDNVTFGQLESRKLFLNRSGGGSGILWYSSTYTAWQDYMAQAGITAQGYGLNITPPTGTYVTSWGRRSFVEGNAGYGWTWEAGTSLITTPTIVAELSSNTGNFRTIGNFYSGANLVLHAGNYTTYAASASTVTNSTTNATYYPTFVTTTGNSQVSLVSTGNFTLNPSTGAFNAKRFGYVGQTSNAWDSSWLVLDFGNNSCFSNNSAVYQGYNVYVNGGTTKYISSTSAAITSLSNTQFLIRQSTATATAGTAVTWVDKMTLDLATGDVLFAGTVQGLSDSRLKTNLVKIESALDKVCNLTGYIYDRIDTGAKQTGLIAQEVQQVLPEAVSTNAEGLLSVAYGNMLGLIVEAIKELKEEIRGLK